MAKHPKKKLSKKEKQDRAHAHAVRIAEQKAARRGVPSVNPATGLKGRRNVR